MEYTNGTKATWRYWAWKRLREEVKTLPSLATVVFLSGPSPEDLVAATKNGFKVKNIVAVDIDENAVTAARNAGCVAIQGDIHDVVKYWSDGKVHAVMADYCCGLSYEQYLKSIDLLRWVDGPVCLNFQRGRESSAMTSLMRSVFEKHGVSKNRAEQFAFMYAARLWHLGEYGITIDDEVGEISQAEFMNDILNCDVRVMRALIENLSGLESEKRMSYRSNVVIMDSIVIESFEVYSSEKRRLNAELHKLDASCVQHKDKIATGNAFKFGVKQQAVTIRRLNAAKAIRTMNGAVRLEQN